MWSYPPPAPLQVYFPVFLFYSVTSHLLVNARPAILVYEPVVLIFSSPFWYFCFGFFFKYLLFYIFSLNSIALQGITKNFFCCSSALLKLLLHQSWRLINNLRQFLYLASSHLCSMTASHGLYHAHAQISLTASRWSLLREWSIND